MRVIVIPDVHLKPRLFDHAQNILKSGKADRAVCLMDIPDDWGMELHIDRYEETYNRAIAFAKEHPDTLWCYGNHDISYVWGKLESGYSVYAEATVRRKLRELENAMPDPSQLAFVHRIGKVLFSHGGLTEYYVFALNEELLEADTDEVIAAVNEAGPDLLWDDESPLWLRPQYVKRKMYRGDKYKQVVGHTPVEKIYEKDGVISTDTFSTYRDGKPVGEQAMVVIESETGEWERVGVE